MKTFDKTQASIRSEKHGFRTSRVGHRDWISRITWGTLSRALFFFIAWMLAVVAARSAQAPADTYSFSTLYTFQGAPDGANPFGDLVRDNAGNLYGTTIYGGSGPCLANQNTGCGVVFKLETNGTEKVLYNFTGGTDGANPAGRLIRDTAGNLYGTAGEGGSSAPLCQQGCGTVFKLDATGKETVLYRFTGGTDGLGPSGGLVRDAVGNLYGVTFNGGSYGHGVVFKLDAADRETALYSFTGGMDGSNPFGELVRDTAGNLYGTTTYGGDLICGGDGGGCGVVFKVDTTHKESVLHSFAGVDGQEPQAGLVRDAAGNLYGTTNYGGAHDCGVVFKIDTTDTETVLYSFSGGADGSSPSGRCGPGHDRQSLRLHRLRRRSHFCGFGCGVVFKLDTTHKETVLYAFTGGAVRLATSFGPLRRFNLAHLGTL